MSFPECLSGKSIALIGNASSLSEKGELIDSFDVVIRFNNGKPQSQFYRHIGSVTDYWAWGSRRVWPELWTEVQCLWCRPGPKPVGSIALPANIIFQLVTKLDAYPSTGLAVIHWLSDFPINLFGFDFRRTHNWFDPPSPQNRTKSHNFVKEEEYIRSLDNVTIVDC